ncbi:MAG: hypothetical protein U0V70_07570 [Terriglobia bacterium]
MNLYLIQPGKKSTLLYAEKEGVSESETKATKGLLDRWLDWLTLRNNRVASFCKKLTIVVHEYYIRVEYKIDPMEHVFKQLRHASEIKLHFSSALSVKEAAASFDKLCARQGKKHQFWFGVDLLLSVVAILLAPLTVPIPGPNLFFYYPGIRTISHFLAWKGSRHGAGLKAREFSPREEILELEKILQDKGTPDQTERIKKLSDGLGLEQLPHFMERYI